MIYLKNTLTDSKELFKPLIPNQASIYVCGVTLYDNIHIGHLKSILTFEILRNYFKHIGYSVKFVRNITDIDDKIINKAVELNQSPLDLVNEYIDKYHQLLNQLEIEPPDNEPRVTDYITKITDYINDLIESGYAYKTEDGIYFNTQKNKVEIYPLSKKITNDLQPTEQNYNKKHPADFALWKHDDNNGFHSHIFNKKGRPGWHIECSVMHHHTLGPTFDIHGGGRDLIFPHHENEITQSHAHNGVNPANYWIHNGMMTHNGKKLSKSLGNSIYVYDLLNEYYGESLKLFLLKGQYNQSQEYNIVELKEANDRIDLFFSLLDNLIDYPHEPFTEQIIKELEDNLNTPNIVALIYKQINILKETHSKSLAVEILNNLKLLSIVGKDKTLETLNEKYLEKNKVPDLIRELANKRLEAKKIKDFTKSDEIRNELMNLGWAVLDNAEGYTLEKIVKSFSF